MTPLTPIEIWPNTTPRLVARMCDEEGRTRNDVIVGWARYHDTKVGDFTIEPVIVEPVHQRHVIFARECDAFQYIVDVGDDKSAAVITRSLAGICLELSELRASLPV